LIKDILKIANARPLQIKTAGGICEDKNPNKIARTKKDMLKKINRTVYLIRSFQKTPIASKARAMIIAAIGKYFPPEED
jgi:hypothetical protein